MTKYWTIPDISPSQARRGFLCVIVELINAESKGEQKVFKILKALVAWTADISRRHSWFPANDVWETSAERPYWWRIFWLVEANFPFERGTTTTRHQYGISARVSQTSFREETSRWRHSVGATDTGLILVSVNASPLNLLIHLDIASLWSRGQYVPRNVADQVSPLSGQLLGSKCSEAQNFLQASQYVWKQSQKL